MRIEISPECGIPRLYAAASLKLARRVRVLDPVDRIPRLYAAASLKLSAHRIMAKR